MLCVSVDNRECAKLCPHLLLQHIALVLSIRCSDACVCVLAFLLALMVAQRLFVVFSLDALRLRKEDLACECRTVAEHAIDEERTVTHDARGSIADEVSEEGAEDRLHFAHAEEEEAGEGREERELKTHCGCAEDVRVLAGVCGV